MSDQTIEAPKATLGRWTLFAMGVGITVGAGVFSLTGFGIGLTGHSITLAFAIAVLLGFFYNLPMIYASGTFIMDGGPYALISTILGKKYAGMYVVSFFLYYPTLAIYAMSLGQYVNSILPNVHPSVAAAAALTVFYFVNVKGMDVLSKFQNFMTAAMLVGIATFVLVGFNEMDFASLSPATDPHYFINDTEGLIKAVGLIAFATYCQYYLMYFSKYAINPKKDIPFAMLGTTIVIAFVYCSIAAVGAGVLPIEVVSNQPLTLVAREILPTPVFIFFMIAGPFMALTTTINSVYAGYAQPIFTATRDNWFPKSFGATNKSGSPYKILTVLWLASLLPIILGWDISTVANTYIMTDLIIGVFMIVAISKIPTKYPTAWANREFARSLPTWVFYLSVAAAALVQVALIANSIASLKLYIVVVTGIAFGGGIIYAIKKEKDHNVTSPILDLE